jgi:hypothetical protein
MIRKYTQNHIFVFQEKYDPSLEASHHLFFSSRGMET